LNSNKNKKAPQTVELYIFNKQIPIIYRV